MTHSIIDNINIAKDKPANKTIIVAGVGGGGGNAVNHMYTIGIEGVNFVVCNTDKKALDTSPIPDEAKIQLGPGLGAGNDPKVAEDLAKKSSDAIKKYLADRETGMLFVTAGMGGGTGTGASPIIAKIAQELGILTVGVVTSPLALEGPKRYDQALQGIDALSKNVDSILVINNEDIVKLYGRLSLKEAFSKADDILLAAVKGIAEIITCKSDLVNIDFADVTRVMRQSGKALMSVASAEGDNRAVDAARLSLESPLLDQMKIVGAKNILLNIGASDEKPLTLNEVQEILSVIQESASVMNADKNIQNADIIWGTSCKQDLGSKLELVVVATGFGDQLEGTPLNPVLPPITSSKPNLREQEPSSIVLPDNPPLRPTILGRSEAHYQDIKDSLFTPAYRRRSVQLTVDTEVNRAEVVVAQSTKQTTASQDCRLFKDNAHS
jgi:cell division protein FtsZ